LPLPTWKFTVHADRCVAQHDFPGVKVSDLLVSIEGNVIKVSGRRFDTGLSVNAEWYIGNDYDAKTAEASLEAGVLTVVVMKCKEKHVHHVRVVER
jgi:HSP20 family molecular chaperone IbpA